MRSRRRWVGRLALAFFLVLLVALGCAAWLGVRGLAAARHLQAARSSFLSARTALTQAHFSEAQSAVDRAGRETAAARRLTADPVWSAADRLPLVGNTLTVSRGIAVASDDVARSVLPGILQSAATLDPTVLQRSGLAQDLLLLHRLGPALRTASDQARQVDARVVDLPTAGVFGPVQQARQDLQTELRALDVALRAAALA